MHHSETDQKRFCWRNRLAATPVRIGQLFYGSLPPLMRKLAALLRPRRPLKRHCNYPMARTPFWLTPSEKKSRSTNRVCLFTSNQDSCRLQGILSLVMPGLSLLFLIDRRQFPERSMCTVKRNVPFKNVRESRFTLRSCCFHASFGCEDRFRKAAALRIRSCKRAEIIWILATRKLHCALSQIDCFGAIAN